MRIESQTTKIKKMKYLIFLLLTFELTAQCKIKVDEFTKRESVQSKLQHIGQGQGLLGIDDQLECQFRRFENIKYVAFYVMGMHIQTIEKGEMWRKQQLAIILSRAQAVGIFGSILL